MLQNGQGIGIGHVVEVRVSKINAVGMVAGTLYAVSAGLLREIHSMRDLHLIGERSRSCGLVFLPGLGRRVVVAGAAAASQHQAECQCQYNQFFHQIVQPFIKKSIVPVNNKPRFETLFPLWESVFCVLYYLLFWEETPRILFIQIPVLI